MVDWIYPVVSAAELYKRVCQPALPPQMGFAFLLCFKHTFLIFIDSFIVFL
jgi:hypothetical protein